MRNSGKTTKQILEAPTGAIFVWCSENVRYVKDLAHALGREDIHIISPSRLYSDSLRGLSPAIVVDHAARLTLRQEEIIKQRFVHGHE